jgi:transcriptional regulator with XRE-family HTH domain
VVTAVSGDGTNPLGKRQALAAELRRVRDLAGLSGRDLAQRIGISQSKVSRIESGTAIPSAPEVTAWAEAAAASAETRRLLATLTEAAFTEVHAWHVALRDRPHLQDDILGLEQRAVRVRTFQPSVIPGLLQTAEYARRVFSLFQPAYAHEDISAALASRLDRQLALFDERRQFEFLITEAALRWRPGPAGMLLAQFDRLASLSTLSNVSIGLIPMETEAVTSMAHGFAIFELAGHDGHDSDHGAGDDIVTVETIHANLTINDPESVALYRKRWSLLTQMARHGDEARTFLASIISDLRAAGR